MAKNSFHVILNPKGAWAVKKGGATRASKVFESKEDAIVWGKRAGRNQASELVIHSRDGTIKDRVTYSVVPPLRERPSGKMTFRTNASRKK